MSPICAAAGCVRPVRGGMDIVCRKCWQRLPPELWQRYQRARRSPLPFGNAEPYAATIADIEQWWADNPAPAEEPALPAWKQPR